MWVSEAERRQHERQDSEWRKMKLSRKKRRNKQGRVTGRFGAEFSSAMREFWKKFGKLETETAKLMFLQKMAKVTLANPIPYADRRAIFDRSKIKVRWVCGVCGSVPSHRHHIVTLRNGGPNFPKNLIALCEWCHAQVHPWMPEPPVSEESMKETMQRVGREA